MAEYTDSISSSDPIANSDYDECQSSLISTEISVLQYHLRNRSVSNIDSFSKRKSSNNSSQNKIRIDVLRASINSRIPKEERKKVEDDEKSVDSSANGNEEDKKPRVKINIESDGQKILGYKEHQKSAKESENEANYSEESSRRTRSMIVQPAKIKYISPNRKTNSVCCLIL